MANLTTNYDLTKPLQSETYDVDVFNANMDKLDTLIKNLESKFTPSVGDVIVTLSGTDPSERYTGTTWKLIEEGRYIRTAGTNYPAGSYSGSNEVTLKAENIPEHTHAATLSAEGNHNHTASIGNAGGHTHTITINTSGDHNHGAYSGNADISGNFRARSNSFYGKGAESVIGTGATNGRFSVLQSGLRSEGNRDSNNTEYICHFNGNHTHTVTVQNGGSHIHSATINSGGNHNHTVTVNESGLHTHTVTIAASGEGKPFTIEPVGHNLYFWVRTA